MVQLSTPDGRTGNGKAPGAPTTSDRRAIPPDKAEDGGVEICDISMPTSLLDFLAPSTNIFQLVVCRKR